jgi:hypothetical protein
MALDGWRCRAGVGRCAGIGVRCRDDRKLLGTAVRVGQGMGEQVARMKLSEIRGSCTRSAGDVVPDCAALHPGYAFFGPDHHPTVSRARLRTMSENTWSGMRVA